MIRPILIACVSAALLFGCGGKQQADDPMPTEETTDGDAVDLDEVDAAELADSPCGNPDWSKLPDGTTSSEPSPN